MQTKNMTITEMDDKGTALALLADMSKVDHGQDGYEKGAFSWQGDQHVPVICNHNQNVMPFAKARVFEEGDLALADIKYNLETQAGREWYASAKFDMDQGNPAQEWSYGYKALQYKTVFRQGIKGRLLKQIDVFEVSPVIRGMALVSGTIDVKSLKAALKEGEFKSIIEQLGTMAGVLQADPAKLSATGLKQLEEIHGSLGAALALAQLDPEAEAKAQAELERLAANFIARDAIRDAEKLIAQLGG